MASSAFIPIFAHKIQNKDKMKLSELAPGQEGVILRVAGHGAFRRRMMEMGFVKGRTVKVMLEAPLSDPVKYSIMGYEVSLRRSEASLVDIMPSEISDTREHADESLLPHSTHASGHDGVGHVINVALVGNPNCGKTTLFNIASGSSEHTGNYSGVTVDSKIGHLDYRGYRINLIDLPGTYSLAAYSPEELYVRRFLRRERADVIVNVVAASALERNLYLTTELIDMDRKMVIALNMYDELEARGDTLDYNTLGEMIGVPVIPIAARTGRGIDNLLDAIIAAEEERHSSVRHVHVGLGREIEDAITRLRGELRKADGLDRQFSTRYLAIKLLEGDTEAIAIVNETPQGQAIVEMAGNESQRIELLSGQDVATSIADEKYGYISGALAENLTLGKSSQADITRFVDLIVTNRLLGFPIFIGVMILMFWLTFYVGAFPMEWIEAGVDWLAGVVDKFMPESWIKDMVADGIIGGVGGVIVFLPNILILYFCISFMEDSGYMARAAFIMDKMMHRIGLHGKSFIPLVMGFGCNVPAIIATRSIESHTSRLITILINPFMSCSARLPIYVLMIGTFFPLHAVWVFLGLYLLGVLVAMGTAKLLRLTVWKDDVTPFVMELPPYRIPTMKASLRHTWAKGHEYLHKMGGVILIASIVVWALNYFPMQDENASTPQTESSSIDPSHDSYLEMIGKAINPVMEPLGLHWRATVAAIAGVPAKEIVVSTLGVLYTGDEELSDASLSARLTAPSPVSGKPDFTAASALAFMIFILLYCPCIATVTAVVKESGSWRYGVFSVVYNTAVAWLAAFVAYRIMLLF